MGLGADAIDAIDADAAAVVARAQGLARTAPFPVAATAFTDVQDCGAPL